MEQYYCKLVNHKGNCPLYFCVRAMGLFFCPLFSLFFCNATKIRCTAEKSPSLWGPCCMCFCIAFLMTFNWCYVKNAFMPQGGTAMQFRPPVSQGEGEDLLFTGAVVPGFLWCGCYGFKPAITVAIRHLFVCVWHERYAVTPTNPYGIRQRLVCFSVIITYIKYSLLLKAGLKSKDRAGETTCALLICRKKKRNHICIFSLLVCIRKNAS